MSKGRCLDITKQIATKEDQSGIVRKLNLQEKLHQKMKERRDYQNDPFNSQFLVNQSAEGKLLNNLAINAKSKKNAIKLMNVDLSYEDIMENINNGKLNV